MKKGMTLIEILIAVGLFGVIIVAIGAFEVNVFSYRGSVSDTLETVQDSQTILKTMTTELRSAAPGANGAYPIISAGTSMITFFSDPQDTGTTEQISYTLIGTTMYKSVIKATGSPPTYVSTNQSTSTLITNVRNSSATPIFQYFDANYTGSSAPLAQPVSVTAVRLIQVSLTLDADPNRSPNPITYSTQVSLRNLKTNL